MIIFFGERPVVCELLSPIKFAASGIQELSLTRLKWPGFLLQLVEK